MAVPALAGTAVSPGMSILGSHFVSNKEEEVNPFEKKERQLGDSNEHLGNMEAAMDDLKADMDVLTRTAQHDTKQVNNINQKLGISLKGKPKHIVR